MSKSKAPAGAFDPSKIKRKPVQLPVLRFEDEVERFLRIETPFVRSTRAQIEGKGGKGSGGGKKGMAPATVCSATDVQTGEMGTIVANQLLVGDLEEKYPKQAYVGLTFGITRHAKEKGKRYFKFSIFEIES